MTVETNSEPQGGCLHLRATGTLTAADYQQLTPAIAAHVDAHGSARLLIELRDFRGWTAGALWHDAHFSPPYAERVERVAIVGDRARPQGLAPFCRAFPAAELRYFHGHERDAALRWLHEARPSRAEVAPMDAELAHLLAALQGEDGLRRERSRRRLVAIGAPAIHALTHAAQHGARQLRLEATRALAAIGAPEAANVLARRFTDTPEIAWAAAEGLRRLGRVGAIAALEQVVADPSSHGVRVAAQHTLRELQDPAVRPAIVAVVAALNDGEPISQAPVAAYLALASLRGARDGAGRTNEG
ncbi:MAG: STAS/SEC14 domain-containing protein [Planctomycetes bacterium]|nr:STAS/SEC14 domain-containing protein [Planctomycetota bacterium]